MLNSRVSIFTDAQIRCGSAERRLAGIVGSFWGKDVQAGSHTTVEELVDLNIVGPRQNAFKKLPDDRADSRISNLSIPVFCK